MVKRRWRRVIYVMYLNTYDISKHYWWYNYSQLIRLKQISFWSMHRSPRQNIAVNHLVSRKAVRVWFESCRSSPCISFSHMLVHFTIMHFCAKTKVRWFLYMIVFIGLQIIILCFRNYYWKNVFANINQRANAFASRLPLRDDINRCVKRRSP